MIELKTNSITAMTPIEARPAPPSAAFAPYLDQAWSFPAATPPAATPAATPRDSEPASAEYPTSTPPEARDAATPVGPGTEKGGYEYGPPDSRGEQPASESVPDAPSPPGHEVASESDTSPAAAAVHNAENSQGAEDAPNDTEAADRAEPTDDVESERTGEEMEKPSDAVAASATFVEHEAAQEAVATGPSLAEAAGNVESKPADSRSAEMAGRATSQEPPSGEVEMVPESQEGSLPGEAASNDEGEQQKAPSQNQEVPEPAQAAAMRRGKAPGAREAAQARTARENGSSHPIPNTESAAPRPAVLSENVNAATLPTAGSDVVPASVESQLAPVPNAPAEPTEAAATEGARTTDTQSAARTGNAAGEPPEANQTETIDRVRFVQRVARAFQASGDRGGTVRLRLSPPELGSLRVEITVNRGVMNAHLEADNEAARQLLIDNLPMLRERLAEQDIKIEQFQVELSDRQPGGLSDQSGNRYPDRTTTNPRRHSSTQDTNTEDSEPQGPRHPGRWGDRRQLDVLI